MRELYNSKRSIERATYTPIRIHSGHGDGHERARRAWEKWSYATNLKLDAHELTAVADHLRKNGQLGEAESAVLAVFQKVWGARDDGAPDHSLALRSVPLFADLAVKALARFGEALAEVREIESSEVLALQERLMAAYQEAQPALHAGTALVTSPPEGFTLVTDIVPAFPGGRLYEHIVPEEPLKPSTTAPRGAKVPPTRGTQGFRLRKTILVVHPPEVVGGSSTSLISQPSSMRPVLDWARQHHAHQGAAERIQTHAQALGLDDRASFEQLKLTSRSRMKGTRDATHGFLNRMDMEPVGYLHLERLSFIPAGIERGELAYSVPLSPGEEVNISHKEWSNTSEEFEKIVTDYIESYSEEGVAEASELTQSTSSQNQHSMGFNTGVTASGGYGPVTITASASLNLNDSSSHSEQSARNHSNSLTRKASSRSKKEHKLSFKVASASGTEDQAVRLIKNPFPDKATRIDYYQLIRKWRVDLYRYGVRLTYDLTIPEPGSDILSKIMELQSLQAALSQGFNAPEADQPWAKFDVKPGDIERTNYMAYAAEYGVAVETPPPDSIPIVRSFTREWADEDEADTADLTSFQVDIPQDYQVSKKHYDQYYWVWDANDYEFYIETDVDTWVGASGMLTFTVATRNVSALNVEMQVTAVLKKAVYDAWKMKVWGALHDAAITRYEENRAMLKSQLENLQSALGAQDALSLRKLEREEVMKNVLRWMFGPTFTFVPPQLSEDLYTAEGSVLDPFVWNKVLSQGEIIKFLHHAIEWENMLYLLYPYFWSHSARWELKKYLDHPDFMHRTFLKAGSARVVLTIRPGFERDFMSFLETGTFNGLPAGHPYLTIAQELEAFAKINYPGIRPANPVNDARPLLSPKQKKAWADMQLIMKLLEDYKAVNGTYPTTEQGLTVCQGVIPLRDPWDTPWVYASPGVTTDYELASLGAGGARGGEEEEADINSWAEASLIGRWYEYTPTSAIDIAFAESLPSA